MFKLTVTLAALACFSSLSDACTPNSPTTSSGSASRPGPYCPGELIFADEFNTLNRNVWQHAITMSKIKLI